MSDNETPTEEKKPRPKAQPKEVMTKELMLKKVNEELGRLKQQAETLQAVVKELEASTRGADASTTTVEKIDSVLEDVSDMKPSLMRLRSTLKARILERLK